MENVEVRLELERAELDAAREAAKDDPSIRFEKEEAIAPKPDAVAEARFVEAVAVVASLGIAWLAKRLVDDWLKSREKGVQIDLRTKPPTISRVAGVPRGFVVIIDKQGKATTQKVDYEKQEDLMPILQGALGNKP